MILNIGDLVKSPSIEYITNTLAERINSGQYKNGQWLPTERFLAEEFRVSRATIRQSLDLLEKNSLVKRSTGCRPVANRINERSTTTGVRRSVGIWITSAPGDSGANMVFHGIQSQLDGDTFRLIMASPPRSSIDHAIQTEAKFLERMAHENELDGIILWYLGGHVNLPYLEKLRDMELPMIFIDRRPPAGFEADYVEVDNEMSARKVVKHLIDLGHRSIAHITNPEFAHTVHGRLKGYVRALEDADISFRPELVVSGDFFEMNEDGIDRQHIRLAQQLAALPDPPTAIFAVNDHAGLSMVAALRTLGVRIPEDIAVAGFDDTERWSPGRSFLTTVSQPFERIGEEAVRLLRNRIENRSMSTFRHVMLDAPLMIRESTAKLKDFHGVV